MNKQKERTTAAADTRPVYAGAQPQGYTAHRATQLEESFQTMCPTPLSDPGAG
eukprot:CAMPEP_0204273284 /NCGR_PEP_ID=MMETSP0468-20130131/23008_1 /ASSEMBLY_ACC=CAM_ASM_000383 /TAXON_ID=2969 /ORGANISM="Oxyrrhis marina" /LENGTH=52 /DNA_ID=CAMNT_0051249269 /DNA_START=114 /DNA_END=269 /DNA_ORIENTATION=-